MLVLVLSWGVCCVWLVVRVRALDVCGFLECWLVTIRERIVGFRACLLVLLDCCFYRF